tara:strand:- start:846 stop:1460 length:615 start_codon:yes stop_codon:yes gene_type:complete
MFPEKLVEVVEFLNDISITVSEKHGDGRVNSIDDEDTIIDLLIEKYGEENIEKPVERNWWDVKVFGYPLNIKTSKYGSAADNFSSKAAILYALTDLTEDEVKVQSWKKFENLLMNHSSEENNRDYYIFSLNKVTNEVHLASLKTLNKLTSNGNNLPFQIKWKDNITPVQRTHTEAYKFLVGCYADSVEKKQSAHDLESVRSTLG